MQTNSELAADLRSCANIMPLIRLLFEDQRLRVRGQAERLDEFTSKLEVVLVSEAERLERAGKSSLSTAPVTFERRVLGE